MNHLEATLVDRYFCNFSVFQSLPDNWAIDQIFPIMPVHRLDEEPIRRGTLQDITCDSDGVIDRFAGEKGQALHWSCIRSGRASPTSWASSSPAPTRRSGDLHNLFGDTNAVHIKVTEKGYEITDMVHGDTVTEVLNYVQFKARTCSRPFRRVPARPPTCPAGRQRVHCGLRGGAGGTPTSKMRGSLRKFW